MYHVVLRPLQIEIEDMYIQLMRITRFEQTLHYITQSSSRDEKTPPFKLRMKYKKQCKDILLLSPLVDFFDVDPNNYIVVLWVAIQLKQSLYVPPVFFLVFFWGIA